MRDTMPYLRKTNFPRIQRGTLQTLQMNLGYLCNIACTHCHVAAGPKRTELMDKATMDVALAFMQTQGVQNLDVTGGSPEMNPNFKYLMNRAKSMGAHLMDRCNPTIIEEPGYAWVPGFLAEHEVEVVASLPCYTSDNVDKQRGKGVFDASIAGLQKLNSQGYGKPGTGLLLNLVYNPLEPVLPPPQEKLQADYEHFLGDQFGIVFNQLFTIANMPIKRYGSMLLSKHQFGDYMNLLHQAHKAENASQVMCRNLVSVDYQGYVYDCDFNQMLDLALGATGSARTHLRDLLNTELQGQQVTIADHCYGCTAGQGSSCGGALN